MPSHPTYQQIVENALEVTGVRIVAMVRFDADSKNVKALAWAGQPFGTVQRALDAISRVVPAFDPLEVDYPALANPLVEAVYLRGESVAAPFWSFTEGTVHPIVSAVADRVLGLREGFLCALKDGTRVRGGLGFYGERALTDRERRVCEAFVREAALTVENAHLAGRVQEHVRHLQEARQRIMAAEERQRQEIAELLHSRVQTNLLLIWSRLGAARELVQEDPERAVELLGEVQADLDRIREREIRQASYLLHPAIIRVGLIPALRSLASRFEDVLAVSVIAEQRVSELDDPLDNRLSEDFRVSVYRIVEEALNNVHRHARADRAEVSIGIEENGVLRLTVEDNGHGYNTATAQTGLGLTVIDNRVEQLGGTWTVVSAPGRGTRVDASLPLR